jgi:hypothetical protein
MFVENITLISVISVLADIIIEIQAGLDVLLTHSTTKLNNPTSTLFTLKPLTSTEGHNRRGDIDLQGPVKGRSALSACLLSDQVKASISGPVSIKEWASLMGSHP